ncbi:hypothetical protein GCM10020229_62610 [Kitasatospora albolonga]
MTYFHGCCSIGDDTSWGANQRHKGTTNTLAALASTSTSWANPIEAHLGPLRQFAPANSHYPNHPVQTRAPASAARRASGGAAARTS